MATVTLPKGMTAILIMDCQNDIVHENGKMNAAMKGALAKAIKERNVLGTIARLAAAGRSAGVPIIHVRHAYRPDYSDMPNNAPLLRGSKQAGSLADGTWGAEIHAEVAPQPKDLVITKTRVSAFYSSPLEGILKAQDITHLVLTGVATDGVVVAINVKDRLTVALDDVVLAEALCQRRRRQRRQRGIVDAHRQ